MGISLKEFKSGTPYQKKKFNRGLKEKIIKYLQDQTKKGYAVSVRDIMNALNINNNVYIRNLLKKLMSQGLVEGRVIKVPRKPPTTYYIWVFEQQ